MIAIRKKNPNFSFFSKQLQGSAENFAEIVPEVNIPPLSGVVSTNCGAFLAIFPFTKGVGFLRLLGLSEPPSPHTGTILKLYSPFVKADTSALYST